MEVDFSVEGSKGFKFGYCKNRQGLFVESQINSWLSVLMKKWNKYNKKSVFFITIDNIYKNVEKYGEAFELIILELLRLKAQAEQIEFASEWFKEIAEFLIMLCYDRHVRIITNFLSKQRFLQYFV
ncbi:hypothetical protein H8356DRAFT_1329250 [Neocallimastix lanati (nom. inval.)]|nr:hypothetical protein H8356DRAFT_1329250 [Neocallimastix sp. JGI-2020a]